MRPRILFVDDHEDTRNMLAAMLGSTGYEVETAAEWRVPRAIAIRRRTPTRPRPTSKAAVRPAS